jgi:hypothetical protein
VWTEEERQHQLQRTLSSLADAGPGTLRAAILMADAGSHSDKFTIGFTVAGTIDVQSPLPDLNNSIAIQGPGAGSLTVQREASVTFTSPIVTVDASQTASLSGLTIANGNDGGIANHGGTLTISDCTISGNAAFVGGGLLNEGALTASGCTISGNSAAAGGGIINWGTLLPRQQRRSLDRSGCAKVTATAIWFGLEFGHCFAAVFPLSLTPARKQSRRRQEV